MGSEWRETTLGQLTQKGGGFIQTGPFGSQLHASDYVEEGIPVIMPVNLVDNRISLENIARITEADAQRLSKHLVQEGDIVYSRRGDVTRKALITSDEVGMFCGTGCLLVRPGDQVDPQFLKYHLSTPENQEWIVRHAIGATMPNLNTSILGDIPLRIPSMVIQKLIAAILGTLDNKIALNRQINTTLESMAQTLFKSWFVDFDPVIDNALAAGNDIPEPLQARAERRKTLTPSPSPSRGRGEQAEIDASPLSPLPLEGEGLGEGKLPLKIQQLFPDSFVFTEDMGWVPEGWEILPLSDVVSDIIDHRGKTPKKLGGDWSENGYPAISAKNIKSGKLIRPDAIRFIDEELYRKWMKVPLVKGDVILTSEAPLGEMYFLAEDKEYVLSQRLFGIRADSDCINGCYLYFCLNSPLARSDLETRATGTTVVGIRQAELKKVVVLSPGKTLSDEFSKLALEWMERAGQLEQQISSLANLRDSLLPRLLSGQLSIPEAEQALDQVM